MVFDLLNCIFQAHTSEGFFTDGCFALVEGTYTDEAALLVNAIGHPPCERRADTRQVFSFRYLVSFQITTSSRAIYSHIDFLGKGATTVLEDVMQHLVIFHPCQTFMCAT